MDSQTGNSAAEVLGETPATRLFDSHRKHWRTSVGTGLKMATSDGAGSWHKKAEISREIFRRGNPSGQRASGRCRDRRTGARFTSGGHSDGGGTVVLGFAAVATMRRDHLDAEFLGQVTIEIIAVIGANADQVFGQFLHEAGPNVGSTRRIPWGETLR